jgi:hypothetical protein
MCNWLRKKRILITGGPFKCYMCGNTLHNEDLYFNKDVRPVLKCSECNSLTIIDSLHFHVLGIGGLLNKYREWILGILGLTLALLALVLT